MWYIHTMQHYSGIGKDEILPSVTTLMDLESIMLSERSQMRKENHPVILLACGIENKKRQMNTQNKQKNKLTDRDTRMAASRGEQRLGEDEQGEGCRVHGDRGRLGFECEHTLEHRDVVL